MTRNKTLNRVRVAATELPQPMSQNTKCLERQPHKVAVRLSAALKFTEKIKSLEVEGARAPVPRS